MRSVHGGITADSEKAVAAGIVLYYPDYLLLKENIQSLSGQVDRIFLIDNSEHLDESSDHFKEYGNVTYVADGINKGIAAALNTMMMYADNAGYEWLLTLDQDSVIPQDFVRELLLHVDDKKDIAVVAPSYVDRNTGRHFGTEGCIEECITSGSLNCVKAWKEVKGFDEYLFIDYVDFEYCERLRSAGWKIYQTEKAVLNHAVGETEYKTLFGREFKVMNHSAFRKYYQMRNYIYWQKKMGRFSLGSTVLRYLAWSIKVVLWEDDKMRKLREMTKGVKDGLLHS